MQAPWDYPDFDDHEVVHFVTDRASGLRAVIAVHSTHLGPAGGGVRFWHYAEPGDAVRDALRLSRGMSFKNAMAGLPLGGGKAVILADENRTKTPEMLAAYGREVEGLGGALRDRRGRRHERRRHGRAVEARLATSPACRSPRAASAAIPGRTPATASSSASGPR